MLRSSELVSTRLPRNLIRALPAALSLLGLLAGGAAAAVSISGSIPLGTGKFVISEDLTFKITTTGNVRFVNFDEWVASNDGDATFLALLPDQLVISVNGQLDVSYSGMKLADGNWTGGDVTANDFYFFSDGIIPVTAGDTLTVRSGTWSIPASPGFPASAAKVFVGNAYLSTGTGMGEMVSEITAIPEPTTAILAGLGALGMALNRRRKC